MGLGGHILWTAVAREYRRKFGRRVFLTNRVFGRSPFPRKIVDSELYRHNTDILGRDEDPKGKGDEIRLDNREALYWHKVTRERIVYKAEGHAIEIASRAYGIEAPEIRCHVPLTEEEEEYGRRLRERLGPYLAIEPHTKDSFTVNKRYGFARWQKVADGLRDWDGKILQVGERDKPILENVVDGTGQPSIRHTAAVLRYASALVAPEGGLMHLANGVGTKAVVVYGGYVHPGLTGYEENINLFSDIDCAPCGLRRRCLQRERECMKRISSAVVCESVIRLCAGETKE